jgi:hypothetical protein
LSRGKLAGLSGASQSGGVALAATTRVYTLALVAKMLSEDEDWLWEISCEMTPEDGCLGIIGLNDEYTVAFIEAGIEYLARFVEIHKANPSRLLPLHLDS